jgi:hypothetical protein
MSIKAFGIDKSEATGNQRKPRGANAGGGWRGDEEKARGRASGILTSRNTSFTVRFTVGSKSIKRQEKGGSDSCRTLKDSHFPHLNQKK